MRLAIVFLVSACLSPDYHADPIKPGITFECDIWDHGGPLGDIEVCADKVEDAPMLARQWCIENIGKSCYSSCIDAGTIEAGGIGLSETCAKDR